MDSHPASHLALKQQYQSQFNTDLAKGEISRLLYPRDSLGAVLLILFLLVPQKRYFWAKYTKLPLFTIIVSLQISLIRRCRSMDWATGYAIGILSAWLMVWSAALMLFSDPQKDFKRMHYHRVLSEDDNSGASTTLDTSKFSAPAGTITKDGKEMTRKDQDSHHSSMNTNKSSKSSATTGRHHWQTYPAEHLTERLCWVLDLVSNFRGIGWNWQIRGLPGPPCEVEDQLRNDDAQEANYPWLSTRTTGNRVYYDRETMLKQKTAAFLSYYLLLDACKILMMKDPYFWGFVDSPPSEPLFSALGRSQTAVRIYRMLLNLLAMNVSLQAIFVMAPVFLGGILGPRLLGVQGRSWMYPDFWGSFNMVLNNGLAGWWGGWWHQSFRYGLEVPSTWMMSKLGMENKGISARSLQLFVAFGLSGFLHACGSYTQLTPTRPLTGPFLFFSLQPLGIMLQKTISHSLKSLNTGKRSPKWLRQGSNFIYVHAWFFFIGPLLLDDFARGGIWLYEPIPISPLRGLGFGRNEESWLCWTSVLGEWHLGRRWWDWGLAL